MDEVGKVQSSSTASQQHEGGEYIDSDGDVSLELVNSGEYGMGYTFFLVPEAPLTTLPQSLIDLLTGCLQNICQSNGWKLEFVTIDPEYLQWAVSVQPAVMTMQIVQQVRTKTSEHINSYFDGIMDKINATDFWIRGYLLLHGLHPHSSDIVERYIRLVRREEPKQKL